MTEPSEPGPGAAPDADLIEYVRITVPSLDGLGEIVDAVTDLVESGAIRVIDVALLHRSGDHPAVTIREPADVDPLTALEPAAEGPVRLSEHDLELIAITVAPGTSCLVLLVEGRWAAVLSSAARKSGGRLSGGERIGRDRYVDTLSHAAGERVRERHGDLLVRAPATGDPELTIDPAAQLRTLARLVDHGILSDEQYEAQRRRVVDG